MNIYRRKTSEFLALRRESALCAFRSLGTEPQLFLHSGISSSGKGCFGSLNPTQIKVGLLPVEGVAEPCVELAFRPSAAAIKGWGCMAELDASPAAVQKDTEENPHEFEELGQSHTGGHGGVCDVAQNATGADKEVSEGDAPVLRDSEAYVPEVSSAALVHEKRPPAPPLTRAGSHAFSRQMARVRR